MFRSSQSVIAVMVVVFLTATGTFFFHRLKRKVEPVKKPSPPQPQASLQTSRPYPTLAGDPWWIEQVVIVREGDSLWSLWKGLKIKEPWPEWRDDTLQANPGLKPKKIRPGDRVKFTDKGPWPLDM